MACHVLEGFARTGLGLGSLLMTLAISVFEDMLKMTHPSLSLFPSLFSRSLSLFFSVLVKSCVYFSLPLSFRATMATAPYNYSYIFKYIIIGKYHYVLHLSGFFFFFNFLLSIYCVCVCVGTLLVEKWSECTCPQPPTQPVLSDA